MATCQATRAPAQYQDDVFLSDTEDGGLLMMEDYDHFTPAAEQFPIGAEIKSNTDCKLRGVEGAASASDQVALCLE